MPINRNDTQHLLKDVLRFSEVLSGVTLRGYQKEIASAVVNSVIEKQGLAFVVMLPRQSGKNEVQAQIEAYLLTLFMNMDYEIVKVSPTWKPQSANAMRRLERTFSRNLALKDRWVKESGYIYRINQTRILFLSASPAANVVGATASLLLECDEAQDVEIAKWDRDIAPMAASTNATRVFYGTAWTSKSLLARELRAARAAEAQDGVRRVFIRNGFDVGAEVPAYMKHVDEQIARLGRQHPMVKTQYFSEEIDAEGGMFSPSRRVLMRGDHKPLEAPQSKIRNLKSKIPIYVFTLDVAGEDEGATHDLERLDNPRRDATALTIFEVEIPNDDPHHPCYKVVERLFWTGTKHTALFPQLRALAEAWKPRLVVVDATGIGSGLATYFEGCMPGQVLPFVFTSASKSKLGWDFIGLIETGRYKEPAWDAHDPRSVLFTQQLDACTYEILEGPGKLMRWGVPDGTRDPATGEYLHDDLIISAALVSVLDKQVWGESKSRLASTYDPLEELGW
jgi:hypothetical protein